MHPPYSASNALTAASAASFALAGFVPVTSLPSVTWNESQTPGGRSSVLKVSFTIVEIRGRKEEMFLHLAPNFTASSSTSGSPQDLTVPRIPITCSPSVVKPVMVLPEMIDLPVEASITPGKMAGPWQLFKFGQWEWL